MLRLEQSLSLLIASILLVTLIVDRLNCNIFIAPVNEVLLTAFH